MSAPSGAGSLPSVLITGATDGLGRAAAIYLADNGYRVFAAGRSAAKRISLDCQAQDQRLPMEALELDVADEASARRAVARVLERAGKLDVLINNAGIAYVAAMEEIRLDDFRRQYETNVFGVVRMIQAALPSMRERRSGRIINMSSIAGKVASPLMGPYASSKFALEGLSDSLRLELSGFGIHVVLIEPGIIHTNMQNASKELSAEYAAGVEQSPYAAVYRGFRNSWKKSSSEARSTPEDCARVILQALRETPPRPRYTVTDRAKYGALAKRFLTDRFLDRRILHAMGLDKPV